MASTESTSRSAQNAAPQLPPKFLEWRNTLPNGPAFAQGMTRKDSLHGTGNQSKRTESVWTPIDELARRHDPVIFVIIETKLGGSKAKEVSDRLPFDGAIHMETIGFFGGLWLLWNEDKVEIRELAKIEQEIHVEVKVLTSNLSWIFSTIYASPRSEERCIFWNNLAKVTELHNKPWIMAGILTNLLFRRINLVEGALV